MGLIDFILNLAGVLLWFSWRSMGMDPLTKTTPATLVGTLRRAEPRRLRGWQFLVGLAALLLLRGVLYRLIGSAADWTPKLNLSFVILAFRSDLWLPVLCYSVLSFARVLIVCYFWLLALALIKTAQTMLSVQMEMFDRSLAEPLENEHLLCTIGFSGKVVGQVYLRMSIDCARAIAAGILGSN